MLVGRRPLRETERPADRGVVGPDRRPVVEADDVTALFVGFAAPNLE